MYSECKYNILFTYAKHFMIIIFFSVLPFSSFAFSVFSFIHPFFHFRFFSLLSVCSGFFHLDFMCSGFLRSVHWFYLLTDE
jgi:hypothetical protein